MVYIIKPFIQIMMMCEAGMYGAYTFVEEFSLELVVL